jgi:hypothetical protein
MVAKRNVETILDEAFLPSPDAGLGLGRPPHHSFVPTRSAVRQGNDLSSPDLLLGRVAVLYEAFEPHSADAHAEFAWEIRSGTQLSGAIH